jgi:hypothetical protein
LRKIEWITFSTDLSLRKRLGDRGVVLPLGHLAQDVPLTRGEVVERRAVAADVFRDESLDDLRVQDRAAVRDRVDGSDELLEIAHALLEEIGTALASPFEERKCVTRSGVLTEDDHTDLRVRLAQPGRGLDPLVRASGWHADVRDDHLGPVCGNSLEQRIEVAADRRDLELVPGLEQTPEALADQVLVFGEHDPNRHGPRIRR